jgi:cytidylate kinase
VVLTVAVSGPDNVGKSTQIRLLARQAGMADAGPLDAHDRRWADVRAGGLAEWWFGGVAVEQVTDVLACSYLARAAGPDPDDGVIRLVDRGMPMLEASVVATAAVRERLGYPAAVRRAGELLAPYRADLARAEDGEWGVLLLHSAEPSDGAARALAREREVTARYAVYQRVLNEHLHVLAEGGRFAQTIVVGDRAVLDVQDQLRTLLRERLGVPVTGVALRRVQVVALGGLSESGKSTAGAYLAGRHGYARLKIGYLLQAAADAHAIADVYALDDVAMAEMLAAGLEAYCAAHHFHGRVSIESLHRAGMTAELARLLGDRLTVIYLEASVGQRAVRNAAGPADLLERDAVKRSRGADQIRESADVVIDNNGPRIALYHALDQIAASSRWPSTTPERVTVADLGLPFHLAAYLSALVRLVADPAAPLVSLLAVTGSGGRGKYQHGWSDLDVLAIADLHDLNGLRTALEQLDGQLQGVKLGFTIISAAEVAAGAITPRLLHTMALIGTGRLPVLWSAGNLTLPCPDPDTDALASLGDGIAAAIEIRRQLIKAAPEIRSLYKVTALLAKVALRAEGTEQPDDADALQALLDQFPGSFHGLGAQAVADARHGERGAVRLACAVLAWWLDTLPAASLPQ